jgi:hypothetical protein
MQAVQVRTHSHGPNPTHRYWRQEGFTDSTTYPFNPWWGLIRAILFNQQN